MSSDPSATIEVIIAQEGDLPLLIALLRAIHAEDALEEGRKQDSAPDAGVRESLARYNALSSGSAWFLLALSRGKPVGYAVFVRIPKLDIRAGFLYLDELHVLSGYRRYGVGTALMERGVALVRDLGLAGIRLLARPKNVAAQRFYEYLGFSKSESILYEQLTGQDGGSVLE
ncbi:GNAT family N-acetyltransferase [Candidatus Bipolaricaulota bacterium]|nr:GNAT family N-acetyltransferase [Candidatus Bipolaricaulota bacterium]